MPPHGPRRGPSNQSTGWSNTGRPLRAAWIATWFGADSAVSAPLAAIVGAPLYLDGYAALPMVGGLMVLGMGFGAALLVAGAAVSLYAAIAVAALAQARVFLL